MILLRLLSTESYTHSFESKGGGSWTSMSSSEIDFKANCEMELCLNLHEGNGREVGVKCVLVKCVVKWCTREAQQCLWGVLHNQYCDLLVYQFAVCVRTRWHVCVCARHRVRVCVCVHIGVCVCTSMALERSISTSASLTVWASRDSVASSTCSLKGQGQGDKGWEVERVWECRNSVRK